jgi:phenylpyruvate tautomerase PptA (4-oxalocrotonate tautomerase family)
MPIAQVCVPEGTLTPDQRREIVKGIHDVIISVEKLPPTGQTYVLINEVFARPLGQSWNHLQTDLTRPNSSQFTRPPRAALALTAKSSYLVPDRL